jgi:hypothetical protein
MKYYTDEELVQRIENYGEELVNSTWLAEKIRERFADKERRISFLTGRLDTAANHIGHTYITELMEEGY